MCRDSHLELVKNDKAFVFRKTSFWISTGITLLVMLISVVIAFTTVNLKAETNSCDIAEIQQDVRYIEEIRYNLRNLCEKQGVTYIERTK
jgi:flagellar basal body-associated protein FliL